jgi:ABC-type nitrate/sulfonate/bicarbonate transport system substrate-binding protein
MVDDGSDVRESSVPSASSGGMDRLRSSSRREFLALGGAAALSTVGGCLGGAVGSGPDIVTFGTLPIAAVAEIFVADERGFFEERNIDLEIKRISSAPKATPQLAAGDLDAATGSIGASTFNSVAQDIPLHVVADQTQYWPGQPSANRIWVRDAMYSEGMSLSDVPDDFTIAVHGQGNVDSYIWGRLLQHNDMTWDDVEVTEILYPNMPAAMQEGGIDACSIPDPLGLQLARQTNAKQLLYGSQVAPEMQIGVYLFGGPFVEKRPDVARRWLEAYLLGVREYYEMGGFPDEEVAQIISDAIEIPVPAIRASVPSLPHKNGKVNVESIMNQQTYHACRGLVDEQVEASAVVDETLLGAALDSVGRLDDPTPSLETIREWGTAAPSNYAPVTDVRSVSSFPSATLCEGQ